ncbi:MAG: ATP-binding cassette domain-containing protein [Lachnospiraceae bacterium]|nr:ATP-binding cassette domain-containing protein [Lachnospiraceae bacterium]
MLKLKDVHWDLPDGEELIKGVDLTISPGKLTVITGPNGGGKTTLAKLIAGLYMPTSGKIFLDDRDITDLGITERAKAGIAYAFQQPVRFKGLTVRQLLQIASGTEMKEFEMCHILEKVGLCAAEYMNRPLDTHLSGGESKRIEIATVLARNAGVLIFDEPEAGIDLWSFSSLIDTFEKLKTEKSGALLIISHQERILNIADEIVLIAEGKIRAQGGRDEVLPTLNINGRGCGCPLGREVVNG